MTKQLISQNQFNAGELSPRLYGRTDIDKYSAGIEEGTNCYTTIHGPIIRRPGTKYVAHTKTAANTIRLAKFQFAKDDAFILEMGNTYMRFFTNSGQVVESTKTITGITQANPGVVTSTSHGYSDGDHVYIKSVAGMTEVNDSNIPYIVANKTANTFELTDYDGNNVNTTGFTAYSSGGTAERIYEITTPYSTAEVADITWQQFGDDIYISHPSYEPRKLTRIASTNWDISTLSAVPEPTYVSGDTSLGSTMTPGATTGSGVTFTSSASDLIDGDIGRQIINTTTGETGRAVITALGGASPSNTATCDIVEDFTDTNAIADGDWKIDLSPVADLEVSAGQGVLGEIVTIDADTPGTGTSSDCFRTIHVGKFIYIHDGIVEITQRVSGSQVKGEVLKTLSDTAETAAWTLEAPAWDSTRGYPRAVGLYQERLCFGGTTAQPQTIWMSDVGIFDSFGSGTNDADAIDITLASSEVNQINWFASTRDLVVGTTGGELTVNGGTSGAKITPSTAAQQPRTSHGSQRQQPVTIGNEVLFLQQSARKVRTFRFNFDIDTYEAEDLTFLAEHITEGGVSELAWSQEPDSRIFAVTNNGTLLSGTYDRSQNVIGWTEYDTDGTYENVQTVSEGEEDQVWICVKRTINSNTRRYIEYFDNGDGTDDTDGFRDSFLTLTENKAITGITAASPAVVTAASHGFSDGDKVIIKDLVDPVASELDSDKTNMSSLNGCVFKVANKTANTFELNTFADANIDTSNYNAYGSGGNVWVKVTTVTGLDSLEGKTVQVKGDGAPQPSKTVSSGSITLSESAGEVVVGLPYTTTITTLRREYNIGLGSMQGQRTRYSKPIIRVYKSTKPLVDGEFLPAATAGIDKLDKKVPLFSGDLEYGSLPWNSTGKLTFTVSTPLPLQLSGIFGSLDGGAF
jgi:hypothetical protein